jgi:hypothetical protein
MNSNLTSFGYIERDEKFFEDSEKILQRFKIKATMEVAMEEEE